MIFDAHLHPEGINDQDLESMRFFGVTAALAVSFASPLPASSTELLAHFEDIVDKQLPRLERAGIHGYAALGVDPRSTPRRGLTEVLAALPHFFHGGKVVAIGQIGLQRGGAAEEEAFREQLDLARRLKVSVLIHTPRRDKERLTRRILNLVREVGVGREKVLIDHTNAKTVRLALECGHYAGLTLHPDELRSEHAVALVRKLGSERLILNTNSGNGAGDILAIPRTVNLMRKIGLSPGVIERVSQKNAAEFIA
jgi:predicted metal-dependent TIM-barrel fold hydrolase